MKCSELKYGAEVVFRTYSNILKREYYEVGTVISVDSERKIVWISWLEGYKDRRNPIKFKDVVAVYHENGAFMEFENIRGESILLECL